MERCFVRFREGTRHVDVAPALNLAEELVIGRPHFSQSDGRTMVATLNPDQQNAARAAGAEIFADFQFQPAAVTVADDVPKGLRFWEPRGIVGPAGPEPWQGRSLADIADAVGARAAWATTKGAGVTIVVVDSGIDGGALEFPIARRSPLSFAPSFVDGPWNDSLGHGSMVASIAAGSSTTGGRHDGLAPEATILSARTNYSATDLYTIYDQLITMRKQGSLGGPVVINNSYAADQCAVDGSLPRDHPYAGVVEAAIAAGLPMVFAAGNNHGDMGCNNPPAECTPNTIWMVNSLDEVVSVGAINWDDVNTGGAHSNSSRGPGQWSNLFPKPDLVAPCYGEVLWGHGYRTLEWWGTSGAAPVVTGIAALTLSAAALRGASLTPGQLSCLLRQNCDAIAGGPACVGRGRVSATKAVLAASAIAPRVGV